MDIIEYNRRAWNKESSQGSRWSTPMSQNIIESARKGSWQVILTPNKPVPRSWFGNLIDKNVLCLASGGGQQAPILAAAGAKVVSFDLSEEQLKKDCDVAKRDGLQITCVQGDMTNLYEFAAESFDLIFHPISNVFVPDVKAVWLECYRILKTGGDLLAGFMNPSFFLFDHEEAEKCGKLIVKRKLPFSEPYDLNSSQRTQWEANKTPAQFSHSLDTQIGGQIAAGFAIIGFYEDSWSDEATLLNQFSPTSIATRARKLSKK